MYELNVTYYNCTLFNLIQLSTDVLLLDWNAEKIRFVLETKYLDTVVHADLTLLSLKEFALVSLYHFKFIFVFLYT